MHPCRERMLWADDWSYYRPPGGHGFLVYEPDLPEGLLDKAGPTTGKMDMANVGGHFALVNHQVRGRGSGGHAAKGAWLVGGHCFGQKAHGQCGRPLCTCEPPGAWAGVWVTGLGGGHAAKGAWLGVWVEGILQTVHGLVGGHCLDQNAPVLQVGDAVSVSAVWSMGHGRLGAFACCPGHTLNTPQRMR